MRPTGKTEVKKKVRKETDDWTFEDCLMAAQRVRDRMVVSSKDGGDGRKEREVGR